MNDYKWTITFTDTSNDNSNLVIKNVKLIDTLNQVTYESDLTEEVSINAASQVVNIK